MLVERASDGPGGDRCDGRQGHPMWPVSSGSPVRPCMRGWAGMRPMGWRGWRPDPDGRPPAGTRWMPRSRCLVLEMRRLRTRTGGLGGCCTSWSVARSAPRCHPVQGVYRALVRAGGDRGRAAPLQARALAPPVGAGLADGAAAAGSGRRVPARRRQPGQGADRAAVIDDHSRFLC